MVEHWRPSHFSVSKDKFLRPPLLSSQLRRPTVEDLYFSRLAVVALNSRNDTRHSDSRYMEFPICLCRSHNSRRSQSPLFVPVPRLLSFNASKKDRRLGGE